MGGVYRLEYAKGSTSMCKGPKPCTGTKIGKGELRFGTVIQFQGKDSFAWRHWGCVTSRIIEGSKQDETKPEELDGFEELREEDQARIVKAYEEGKVAEEDIPESAKIHLDEEGNVIPYVAPVVVKEKKKAAPRKKAAKKDSDDEGDDDEDKPKKKPAKKVTVKAVAEGKKAAPKKQTKAKKAKSESEGDDDSEAEAISTDEDKPKKKGKAGKRSRKDEDEDVPPPRAPSSRARGPVKSFKELLTSDEEDDDKPKKSAKKSKKADSDEDEDSD